MTAMKFPDSRQVGPHAGEILAVVRTSMIRRLAYQALRDAVFTHPITAEGRGLLFGSVPSVTQTNAVTRDLV